MDHWEKLRQEVYDFNSGSWPWLQLLLETWPRPAELPVVHDYLSEHLGQSAHSLFKAHAPAPEAPWWPLVTSLSLPEANDEAFARLAQAPPRQLRDLTLDSLSARQIGALHSSGALEHLNSLALHGYHSPGMLGWRELLSRPLPALEYLFLLGYEENMISALLALGQAAPQPRLMFLDMESMELDPEQEQSFVLGLARLVHHPALTHLTLPRLRELRAQAGVFLDTALGQRLTYLGASKVRADQLCGALVDTPMPQLEGLHMAMSGLDMDLWSTWLEQQPNQLNSLMLHRDAVDAAADAQPHWGRALGHHLAPQLKFLGLSGYPIDDATASALWRHRPWPRLEQLQIQLWGPMDHSWLEQLQAPRLKQLNLQSLSSLRPLLPLLKQPLPMEALRLSCPHPDPDFWGALASSPWWETLHTVTLGAAGPDEGSLERLLRRPPPPKLRWLTLTAPAQPAQALRKLQQAGWLRGLQHLGLILSTQHLRTPGLEEALAEALEELEAPALASLHLPRELTRSACVALMRSRLPMRVKRKLLDELRLQDQDHLAQALGVELTQEAGAAAGFWRSLQLDPGAGRRAPQALQDRARLLAAQL